MTQIKQASFFFSGSSPSFFTKTTNVPGTIEDVFLTHQKYTGRANKTCRWKIIGSVLQVTCSFWGYSGSSGTASLGFNIYYSGRVEEEVAAVAIEENIQILSAEISGNPGDKFEKSFDDLGGKVTSFEFLGQNSAGMSDLELKIVGDRGLLITGQFDSSGSEKIEDVLYVQVSTKPGEQ